MGQYGILSGDWEKCGAVPCGAGRPPERGGVGVRVLLAGFTLLIMGALIAVMLGNYRQRQQENHRKAVEISEYGLQTALETLAGDPSWAAGITREPCKEGWYSVSLRRFARNDTPMVQVTSIGHRGGAVDRKECLLARVLSGGGDSTWLPKGMH